MTYHEIDTESRSYHYPHSTCIECGRDCLTQEEVFDGATWELWVYCPVCDVETFHPRVYEEKK